MAALVLAAVLAAGSFFLLVPGGPGGDGGSSNRGECGECSLCHVMQEGFPLRDDLRARLGDLTEGLSNDAHAGFYDSLGETPETASSVCHACHAGVEIDMTVIPSPALPLRLGPTYATPAP